MSGDSTGRMQGERGREDDGDRHGARVGAHYDNDAQRNVDRIAVGLHLHRAFLLDLVARGNVDGAAEALASFDRDVLAHFAGSAEGVAALSARRQR